MHAQQPYSEPSKSLGIPGKAVEQKYPCWRLFRKHRKGRARGKRRWWPLLASASMPARVYSAAEKTRERQGGTQRGARRPVRQRDRKAHRGGGRESQPLDRAARAGRLRGPRDGLRAGRGGGATGGTPGGAGGRRGRG